MCPKLKFSDNFLCVHNKSEYEGKEGFMDKASLKLASYFGRILFKRALCVRSNVQRRHPALTVSLEFAIGHFSPLCECVTIRYKATTVFLKSTAIIHEMAYTAALPSLFVCVNNHCLPSVQLYLSQFKGGFLNGWLATGL